MRKGPLANSYVGAVVLVVAALIPYLALTSAMQPLSPVIGKSLGLSKQAMELTTGMANAAYAFGTVLAVQFAVHLPQRRMLLLYMTLFVISSVLAAWAPVPGLFIAGHVVQGLTTSLMLIAAVPPLVIGWPVARMRFTGIVMNLCIFGAVALGPVVGGIQAGAGDWRPLFWIVAGISGLAFLFALLTYEDVPAQDRSAPWDLVAVLLAGFGCAAAFFGASELTTHRLLEPLTFIPLVAGAVLLVALVVYEYLARNPLLNVRQIATTIPVAGVLIAMTAGASSVAIVDLVENALQKSMSPTHLAMLFWPEFGGAVVAALCFGALFRTRLTPVLAFTGMALIAGGGAVVTGVSSGGDALVVVGSGVLGLGVGASVSPALFISGFSIASDQLQRVFALVELLRGVAAFMVGPLLLHLAMTTGRNVAAGGQAAIWVAFAIAAAGGLVGVYLFVLGRVRLQVPDLEHWEGGEGPAWESPPLLAGIRNEAARAQAQHRAPVGPLPG